MSEAKNGDSGRSAAECLQPVVMLPTHPCHLGGGEFDHNWKFQDDSFDHEFGTQQIHYWICENCGAEREMEEADYDFYDDVY